MAKLTVAQIRQQIAALEAKARRIAEDETKASVAKVRLLMDSLGVTIEHLSAAVSKKVRAAKKAVASKKAASAKRSGAGAVRYRDPATGATWSGFGRPPTWLASAGNREDFAVSKASAGKAKKAAAPKKASRAATKSASSAKKAAGTATRAAKKVKATAAPAPAKKAAPRKAAAKKAAAASPAASEASASS